MIPLTEINIISEQFNVPAEIIEKDYVICWILCCLARSTLKKDFIFYGGTAIKRIYFENHRFSEDIDLISDQTFNREYLIEKLASALEFAGKEANLTLEIDEKRFLSNGERMQIFIRYSGYDEIIGASKEVRIDFVMGMDLYGETTKRKIFETYNDLKKKCSVLRVKTLNTILAEKLGLLINATRKEPRDIFDIWFLMNRLDQFDFSSKLVHKFFKQKYGFYPSLSLLRPHLENSIFKERWKIRLEKQIDALPKIDVVIKDIEDKLKKLF